MKPTLLAYLAIMVLAGVSTKVHAQQQPIPRIGVLAFEGYADHQEHREVFLQSLKELGYTPGQRMSIEFRYGDGNLQRLAELAADLTRLQPALIVAGGPSAVEAAMKATATIPIVMTNSGNPVTRGFVKTLSSPGGNVTGLSSYAEGDEGKRLELLKEAFPRIGRVVLLNTDRPTRSQEYERAGKTLGLDVQVVHITGPKDLEEGLNAAVRLRPHALVTVRRVLTDRYTDRIAEFAVKHRLPSMHEWRRYVESGGLMSYGIDYVGIWKRAAVFVDKIIKGANPATLPVEPPHFEFVINLNTAKTLGISIPPGILLEANELIR